MLMYFLGKAEQVSRLVVGMTWLFSFFSSWWRLIAG
jgi:hypothetical protein